MNDFVSIFTNEEIMSMKIGREHFLVKPELQKIIDNVNTTPYSAGVYLGMEKGKAFHPSTALLEILSKKTDRKVFVNDDVEWLYLCGRDLMGKGITKSNVKKGLVLVQNSKDENLGYGKIIADLREQSSIVVKNMLDRGDFLRRER